MHILSMVMMTTDSLFENLARLPTLYLPNLCMRAFEKTHYCEIRKGELQFQRTVATFLFDVHDCQEFRIFESVSSHRSSFLLLKTL
jgi:hypothetical protein